ncbi:MAG TPA: antitoxin [Promineifilum sp.]|nr:antitoxin [Promineifilum sp.]HRO91581.1 antitoxin [Promineifilum sp.]
MDDNDKFDTEFLDEEERDLIESYERDEWIPVPNMEARIAEYQEAARTFFRKDRRVNIRISNRDVLALQEMAQEDGIPYQTLMSSILHKYVTGRLVERPRTMPRHTELALHEEQEPYDS